MRTTLAVLMVAGSLTAAPLGALAATPAGTPAPAAKTPKTAKSDHATTGTVKSLSDTSLVLTKSGKKHHEMTFQLDPSVHKDGAVAVGSHVSIRYRDDGKKHVATAITAKRRPEPAEPAQPDRGRGCGVVTGSASRGGLVAGGAPGSRPADVSCKRSQKIMDSQHVHLPARGLRPFLGLSIAAVLIGGTLWHGVAAQSPASTRPGPCSRRPSWRATSRPACTSYADLVKAVAPSVVTIRVEGRAEASQTSFDRRGSVPPLLRRTRAGDPRSAPQPKSARARFGRHRQQRRLHPDQPSRRRRRRRDHASICRTAAPQGQGRRLGSAERSGGAEDRRRPGCARCRSATPTRCKSATSCWPSATRSASARP